MKWRNDIDLSTFENRFQEILQLKRQNPSGYPLMDFGIGEEKSAPDPRVVASLEIALIDEKNHKYMDRGLLTLKEQARKYLDRQFQVEVKEKEIAITMGTKAGLSILPSMFIQPNDVIVTTTPGYIVLENVARFYGAESVRLPLLEENHFLPDLSKVKKEVWEKTKILSLNYPNNPTGAVATKRFYQQAIALAKKYHFLIVNDAAYLSYTYEEEPLSFLSVEGAKEVGVEFFTLSKSHNMTGYRIGFIAGNEEVIQRYETMCDYFDSGQFGPIQYAACYALDHDQITEKLKAKYQIRRENIMEILKNHHLEVMLTNGTFYLYVAVPKLFQSARAFSRYLLEKVGIMTIPYDEAGHYIRLSMTYQAERELPFYLDFDARLNKIDQII